MTLVLGQEGEVLQLWLSVTNQLDLRVADCPVAADHRSLTPDGPARSRHLTTREGRVHPQHSLALAVPVACPIGQ